MDMSEPAIVAMPRGKAAVLRVLAGAERSFTTRELGRLAGVTHERAAQVVRELSRQGVINVEVRGRAQLCLLNRDHVAAAPLIDLVNLRRLFMDRLREQVLSWPVAALHASVFGSVARGDGDVDSDVDVLVVRPDGLEPDDEQWLAQLYDTAEAAYSFSGNTVAWFELSMGDLRAAVRAREAIIQEWQRDAVHLTGSRLDDVLREAA